MQYSKGDLILAALSDKAKVSWREFSSLVQAFADEDVRPWHLLRTFLRLGHVDQFHQNFQSLWVVPPTLSLLPNSEHSEYRGVLCGARTPEFLEELENSASDVGVEFEVKAGAIVPSTVLFRASSVESLVLCAANARVVWAEDAWKRLALVCPNLVLENTSITRHELKGQKSIAWLNPKNCQFEGELESNEPALAEVEESSYWKRYYLVDRDSVFRVNKSYGIHYCCTKSGTATWSYSGSKRELVVRGRAALPSLLERAAVLCSGIEPEYRKYNLVYSNVDPDFAPIMEAKLNIALRI